MLRFAGNRLAEVAGGLAFPNGLARLESGELVIAETKTGRLLGWSAPGCEPTSARVVARGLSGPGGIGGPDGLAVLPDGRLVAAVYGAGHLMVLDPEAPAEVEGPGPGSAVPVPGDRPTNVCHDGTTLYCTEADTGTLWACPLDHVLEQTRA